MRDRFFLRLLLWMGLCFAFQTQAVCAQEILLPATEVARPETRSGNGAQRETDWGDLEAIFQSKIMAFKGDVGVVVKDMQTGRVLAYQADRLFPAASVIKVGIMAACLQAVQDGRLQLEDRLQMQGSDRVGGSGVLWLKPLGESYSLIELMDLMITRSDNTAANMLVNALGMDYCNQYFQNIGLQHTRLERKMMDFSARRRGIENFVSASDMALIFEKLYRYELLAPEMTQLCLDILRQQRIRDRIPAKLPQVTDVAHKTGLENSICHDVGIVYTPKGDYLICVLVQTRTSFRRAKNLIADLALEVYKYMQQQHWSDSA